MALKHRTRVRLYGKRDTEPSAIVLRVRMKYFPDYVCAGWKNYVQEQLTIAFNVNEQPNVHAQVLPKRERTYVSQRRVYSVPRYGALNCSGVRTHLRRVFANIPSYYSKLIAKLYTNCYIYI